MFGPVELIVILFLIFLLLGPKRIAGLLKSTGRGLYDFTDSLGRDKKSDKDKELPEENQEEIKHREPR